MPSLPDAIVPLLSPFASRFDARTWRKAQRLLVGAVLAPGRRTVCACLRVLGRPHARDFALYHQVLNQARWSPLAASRRLLALLLRHLDPGGPLVFGLDETIERRAGPRIAAKGVYRDAVRSSHSHFVKAMGLRWLSLMWLVEIPWAGRVWALPFLTALAPLARYHADRGRRHKTLTDGARPMLCLLRRWLPDRELVVVADQAYAALRLRLDAALYAPETGPDGAPAIARTTPVLLGLFSWVTVVAHALLRGRPLVPRQAAWYPKTAPTFTDALALVRATLWTGEPPFARSRPPPDMPKPPPLDPARLWEFLCYTG